jgi:F-type H+-transporting ATPase subunit a
MLLSLTLKNTTKKNKSIISSHVSSVNNAPAFTNFLSVSSVCSTSFLDPLEQFEMFSLLTINHSSMFNSLALFLFANLAIAAFLLLTYTVSAPTHNTYSMATYALYNLVKTTVKENLAIKRQQYFAPLFYLFITILLANLVGLFPFSFTVTSSFIFTLFIALMHFSGINLIGVFQHK